MGRKWRNEADRHAFFLTRKVDKAVEQFDMISHDDRILAAVSGGKDSLALLRLLSWRLRCSPAKYELLAAHVRGDARGRDVDLPNGLVEWVRAEGFELHVREMILPDDEPLPMDCERCSRNRRRTLFEIAEELGCNKVALGHNLEDFAHTALINLFSSGKLETMEFRRDYFGGRFAVVRPLAFVREHELVRFATACEFPVQPSDCPLASGSRRSAARDLMRRVGKDFRSAAINLVRAACRNATGLG